MNCKKYPKKSNRTALPLQFLTFAFACSESQAKEKGETKRKTCTNIELATIKWVSQLRKKQYENEVKIKTRRSQFFIVGAKNKKPTKPKQNGKLNGTSNFTCVVYVRVISLRTFFTHENSTDANCNKVMVFKHVVIHMDSPFSSRH